MSYSDTEIDSEIGLDFKDATDQLYANMLSGVLITAIAYFTMVALFRGSAPNEMVYILEAVMGVLVILRLVDWNHWRKHSITIENAPKSKRRFTLLALLTGVCWATAACLLADFQTLEDRYFTLLTLGSMTGGAVIVLSTSRLLSVLYPTCLLLPISVMSLFAQTQSLQIVGALGIAYWLIMLNVSRRASVNSAQSIRFKNVQLTMRAQMESERNELANAYKNLSIANAKLDSANSLLEHKVEKRTAEIYRLSNLDPLTGLLNRSALLNQLQTDLDQNGDQALAVLYLDLNGFKAINDSLGHAVGDQVLVEVAKRLSENNKHNRVSRWGGDEFIILTHYSTFNQTLAYAKLLLTDLSVPINIYGSTLQIDASIGVAIHPEHASEAMQLIEKADVAMYKNKRDSGPGVLFFDEQLKAELTKQQTLLAGLKQVIHKQQLYLVYQPVICAKTGSLWGVEALVRWQFGSELVRPDVFIPLAEKTGLIVEIGHWVLTESCSQLQRWQHASKSELSVNVSAMQLGNEYFAKVVENALLKSGLQPEKLHLEVTETAVLDYESNVMQTIQRIRRLGVKVSIDDFGTGYSSFSQLKSLPADALKIDRSFVADVSNGEDVMVRAALLIASEYNYKTVAEGIETEEQANYLLTAGVNFFQGFLFSKPLSSDDLDAWWRDNHDGVKNQNIWK